jgi:hypothetical protein
VEVDDIEIPVQQGAQLPRLYSRPARLLGDERRQQPEGAAQAMHHNSVLLDRSDRPNIAIQGVGIFAMHHFDMVPFRNQGTGQCLNEDGIPAKMVRRIESGDHAEAHPWSSTVRGGGLIPCRRSDWFIQCERVTLHGVIFPVIPHLCQLSHEASPSSPIT